MPPAETQHEIARNQLLRRVDWRFLLSNPLPHTSTCFTEGQLADAVAQVSERVLPFGSDAECDLAVAVDPVHPTLRAAHNVLRHGGDFYSEWYSPLLGGPAAVRQRLEAAGFVDVACYWAWPLPNRGAPLFWLSLDSPAAIRYFLSHRPRSRSLASAMMRIVQRVVWQAAYSTNLVGPLFVTARKASIDSDAVSKPGWPFEMAPGSWEQYAYGAPSGHLASLLLTGGSKSINKVVSLIFVDDEPEPRLIVKQPRVPESIPMLAHEAATLGAVQGLRPNGIPGVPRVLFWEQAGGNSELGETALDGQPVFTLLRHSNYHRLALQATDWLTNLVSDDLKQPRNVWWPRLVAPALANFEDTFGIVIDRELLDYTRVILATLGDLPLTCEQRDFSPWNVLIAPDDSLVVLDWESAELQGLPGLDLIYFLTYLAFFLDGAMESQRYCDSYHRSLDAATFTGQIALECQSRYVELTGVAAEDLCALRLLVWIIHTRSEYRQLTAEAGGAPLVEQLRNSLFFNLWNIEARRMMHSMAIN